MLTQHQKEGDWQELLKKNLYHEAAHAYLSSVSDSLSLDEPIGMMVDSDARVEGESYIVNSTGALANAAICSGLSYIMEESIQDVGMSNEMIKMMKPDIPDSTIIAYVDVAKLTAELKSIMLHGVRLGVGHAKGMLESWHTGFRNANTPASPELQRFFDALSQMEAGENENPEQPDRPDDPPIQ